MDGSDSMNEPRVSMDFEEENRDQVRATSSFDSYKGGEEEADEVIMVYNDEDEVKAGQNRIPPSQDSDDEADVEGGEEEEDEESEESKESEEDEADEADDADEAEEEERDDDKEGEYAGMSQLEIIRAKNIKRNAAAIEALGLGSLKPTKPERTVRRRQPMVISQPHMTTRRAFCRGWDASHEQEPLVNQPAPEQRTHQQQKQYQQQQQQQEKEQEKEQEKDVWVECSRCRKWRKVLPGVVVESLPDVWYCSLNSWDNRFATCAASEQSAESSPSPLSSATPLVSAEADSHQKKEKKRRRVQQGKENGNGKEEVGEGKEKEKEQLEGQRQCHYMVWGEQCTYHAIGETDFCFTHLRK